jgi:hypothetical protein
MLQRDQTMNNAENPGPILPNMLMIQRYCQFMSLSGFEGKARGIETNNDDSGHCERHSRPAFGPFGHTSSLHPDFISLLRVPQFESHGLFPNGNLTDIPWR